MSAVLMAPTVDIVCICGVVRRILDVVILVLRKTKNIVEIGQREYY